MAFNPMRSMVTGDSMALVWVLVADTTISSESVVVDTTSTSTTSLMDLTTTSWVATPTPDTTSVKGYFVLDGTLRANFPASSVVVPTVVPLMVTESLPSPAVELVLTLPLSTLVWANPTEEYMIKISNARMLPIRFIRSFLYDVFKMVAKLGIVKVMPKKIKQQPVEKLVECSHGITLAP